MKSGQQKADFQMHIVVTGFAKIRDTIEWPGSVRYSYRTWVAREMQAMFVFTEYKMQVHKCWMTLCIEMPYCRNACCNK